MENNTLSEIKEFIVQKLKKEYGYCGLAEGSHSCFINSGDNNGNDIIININIKPEGE